MGDHSQFWLLVSCFGLIDLKDFKIIWLSKLSIVSVPDEGYTRNTLCALNLISTFLLEYSGVVCTI